MSAEPPVPAWADRHAISRPTPSLRIANFRPVQKNTLRGFVTVEHISGLVLHEVGIHCRDGKWWASPPARPVLVNGAPTLDDRGKPKWQQIIEFRTRDLRNSWSDAVIAAFHRSVTVGPAGGGAQP